MLGRRFICPIGPATEREFILDWRILNLKKYANKVQLFWEGHKNLSNRPYGFDIY